MSAAPMHRDDVDAEAAEEPDAAQEQGNALPDRPGTTTQSVLDALYRYVLMVLLSTILMAVGAVAAMIYMEPVMAIDAPDAFICIP